MIFDNGTHKHSVFIIDEMVVWDDMPDLFILAENLNSSEVVSATRHPIPIKPLYFWRDGIPHTVLSIKQRGDSIVTLDTKRNVVVEFLKKFFITLVWLQVIHYDSISTTRIAFGI